VLVQASAVEDVPSEHLPASAVGQGGGGGWVPAEVAVGDWVSARSRVELRFVR
jgi:hypothetical protein